MTDFHINEISNILYSKKWEYLQTLNTNQSFDIFHNRLIKILVQVGPEVTVRISAAHKIKDPWVSIHLHKFAERLSKLYKKSIGL